MLLEPPVSDDATEARAAPRRPAGLTPVPSDLPTVGVRVSPGADRRLLVVAAELESGWTATVGGAPVAVVPAWGHLVGVPVGDAGGPVVVGRDDTARPAAPAPAAGARAVHGALGPALAHSPRLAVRLSGVTPRVTSVFDHLGFPCGDVETSVAFYTAAFAPLGMAVAVRIPTGPPGAPRSSACPRAAATPASGSPPAARSSRSCTSRSRRPDRAAVDAVHEAAVAHGAEVLHAPRIFPEYHPGYYAVFLRDPDGHNVEAVHHSF